MNIYEQRYKYMSHFVAGKVAESHLNLSDDDIRRTIYTSVERGLDELAPNLNSELTYRLAMWAMIGAVVNVVEDNVGEERVAALALDVSEELAAIATTYYPRQP